MTIKEVEERTGLARSNIRFYEKEGLISPDRNAQNGYRDYTEENVEDILKIAYLRTLGVTIETVRRIMGHEILLREAVSGQEKILEEQIADLEKAKAICRMMAEDEGLTYDNLDIGRYVPEIPEYWKDNKKIFRLDSVSFLYLWGGFTAWAVIAAACLVIALLAYGNLPEQIPIQYSGGQASTMVKKIFIFAYPAACVVIRLFFRTYFRWKLRISDRHINDLASDYLTNFFCFVALSAEVFSILFVFGYVKNVVLLLAADAVVFIGMLILGVTKLSVNGEYKNTDSGEEDE